MARTRNRVDTRTGNRRFKPDGTITYRTIQTLNETCVDETLSGDNHPLSVSRTLRTGGLVNGETPSNLSGHVWTNWPSGYWSNAEMTSHLSLSSIPSNSQMAVETTARTQPYRPSTTLWEYVDELSGYGSLAHTKMVENLKGLTSRISTKSFRRLKRAAKINLLIQFGILPLVSDIELLLSFSEHVDKRVQELERLYGPKGLRRSVALWEGTTSSLSPERIIESSGVTLKAKIRKTTKLSIRGHVRWYANHGLKPADAQLRQIAKEAILGFSLNSKTGFGLDPYVLYELMPWSWLIDYFTNLGDLVKSTKNFLTVTHDKVRIMRHFSTVSKSESHVNYSYGGYSVNCTPLNCTVETKTRTLTTPSLIAYSDLLTSGQMSILGSLAVLRL